jgi:uncharacterized membrane protein YfcA
MELLFIFLIGFLSSLLGSFASGITSLLSLTGLLAFGLPSYTALATHRFGLFGFDLGGIREYAKHNKIDWKLVPALSAIGVVAAYIGSHIILAVDQELLTKLVGFAVLIFIPLMVFKPHLGVVKTEVTKIKKWLGYVAYFFATIWGSSFNIGIGIFLAYTHMYFFGQTITETKATSKIPGLVKNVVVISVFFSAGILNIQFGLVYLVGMFAGATLATKIVLKIGDVWLRNILFISLSLLALKLVMGY